MARKKLRNPTSKSKRKKDRPKINKKIGSITSTDCRICLKSANVPIFGIDTSENISENIKFFTGIEITENDKYSKFLCSDCYTLLKKCILFRRTAQETDKLLKHTPRVKAENHVDIEISSDKEEKYDTIIERDYSYESDEEPNKYHCYRCNIDFDNRTMYSEHTKSYGHKNFKVECSICKKKFGMFYIKKHMLSHKPSSEQHYICDVCGKSFVMLAGFNRHKATHGFDLPFRCYLCPYRGRFTESLRMHMRTHTGERPYPCTVCPARFVNKSNLNKHSLTHKSVHNYKCEKCGRGYYGKRDLELHIKVDHSGIKEHVCNICGKAFGYRKQMMKHQLGVHKREKLRSGRMPLYLQLKLNQNNDSNSEDKKNN